MAVRDAAALAPLLADPRLYTFTGGEPPTLADLRARFARLARGHSPDGRECWLNWVVREAGPGCAVGTVQATVATRAAGADGTREEVAELAWTIGVAFQGRGYATEAARELVAWLRRSGIGRFQAHIHPGHVVSQAVARAVGLEPGDRVVHGERRWISRPEASAVPDGSRPS